MSHHTNSKPHAEQRLVGELIRAFNEMSLIGRRTEDDLEHVRQDLERCGYIARKNTGHLGQPVLTLVDRIN